MRQFNKQNRPNYKLFLQEDHLIGVDPNWAEEVFIDKKDYYLQMKLSKLSPRKHNLKQTNDLLEALQDFKDYVNDHT